MLDDLFDLSDIHNDKKSAWTHDSVNNLSVDWYTPPWIFDELGLVFDLDPASPQGGVPWIPVANIYTIMDDGLAQEWNGRVWLNPPYGVHTPKWLKRMDAHRNGIALVFARTDCSWFHDYCIKADAMFFFLRRIRFVDQKGNSDGQAGCGSMLVAWGDDNVAALRRMKRGALWIMTECSIDDSQFR